MGVVLCGLLHAGPSLARHQSLPTGQPHLHQNPHSDTQALCVPPELEKAQANSPGTYCPPAVYCRLLSTVGVNLAQTCSPHISGLE
jgi:hypothetical protein